MSGVPFPTFLATVAKNCELARKALYPPPPPTNFVAKILKNLLSFYFRFSSITVPVLLVLNKFLCHIFAPIWSGVAPRILQASRQRACYLLVMRGGAKI